MARNNTARKQAEAPKTAETPKTETEVKKIFPTTEEMVKLGLNTKSSRIRHLFSLGMEKGAIAKQETNGLYQHVYNVLQKPLKRGARDDASKAASAAAKPAETTTDTESTEQTPVEENVVAAA